ncbi:hypothetical protein [Undibacterium fentianense]|uniref:Uncharacterized protein n=1 Tax=Undibacterium fentianense TaxID=2828728 RepID=A0A941IDE1_9BURK|nr:hypothetical protein [Undibacterium fentianense]MBR7799878.1 hypothetical protein [Undibacterium fentianense]
MLREKLFLSIIFLILSMLASLACIPLFGALIADPNVAKRLSSGIIIVMPVISLVWMWLAKAASPYSLRQYSFLAWATVLCIIGVSNFWLVQENSDSHSAILVVGLVCAGISFHAQKKHLRRQQAR